MCSAEDPFKLQALDFTVGHMTASATAIRSMESDLDPGVVSRKLESEKRAHYTKFGLQQGVLLRTLAFETYGRETEGTAAFIKAVCIHYTGLERGWQHHPFSRRWRTRIHAALQVGNARIIRDHLAFHHAAAASAP